MRTIPGKTLMRPSVAWVGLSLPACGRLCRNAAGFKRVPARENGYICDLQARADA
jgi:hypothetical protein